MPQVVVNIDGKTYRMACGDGEEPHLTALAAEVDRKIGELREGFGQIGDLRLTVMAAITATDELFEARRRIAELEGGMDRKSADSGELEHARLRDRDAFVESLNETAAALERIGTRLGSA